MNSQFEAQNKVLQETLRNNKVNAQSLRNDLALAFEGLGEHLRNTDNLSNTEHLTIYQNESGGRQMETDATSNGLAADFKYQMADRLTTVKEVWDEYITGIGGNPSIEYLDSNCAGWRRFMNDDGTINKKLTDKVKKRYSRRKKIYDAIKKRMIANSESCEDSVEFFERLRVEKGMTLNCFQEVVDSF
jgi:hypothetical protein